MPGPPLNPRPVWETYVPPTPQKGTKETQGCLAPRRVWADQKLRGGRRGMERGQRDSPGLNSDPGGRHGSRREGSRVSGVQRPCRRHRARQGQSQDRCLSLRRCLSHSVGGAAQLPMLQLLPFRWSQSAVSSSELLQPEAAPCTRLPAPRTHPSPTPMHTPARPVHTSTCPVHSPARPRSLQLVPGGG